MVGGSDSEILGPLQRVVRRGVIGSNGKLIDRFSEHNAVAIRRHDRELAHPPRLVLQPVPYLHLLLQDLLIQTGNVSNMKVRKP